MQRQQMIGLAQAVRDLRPEWHQPGILDHIQEASDNWAGTDAELYSHIIQVAASPVAQTPAAFHVPMPPEAVDLAPRARGFNELSCAICGRRKSECQRVHAMEERRGVPGPHIFESEEEAVGSAVPLTAERKAEIVGKIGSLFKRVNDVPGMAHAVESAQAAEELAAAKLAQDGLL